MKLEIVIERFHSHAIFYLSNIMETIHVQFISYSSQGNMQSFICFNFQFLRFIVQFSLHYYAGCSQNEAIN